jgi:hypothetical protein
MFATLPDLSVPGSPGLHGAWHARRSRANWPASDPGLSLPPE